MNGFRFAFRAFTLTSVAIVAGLFVSGPAKAQYAFGFSSYDGNEVLNLETTTGAVTLSTNGFQGWVSGTYENTIANTNYFVGSPDGSNFLNNYFAFQIGNAGIAPGSVLSATLSVSPFTITNVLTYRLGDATSFVGSLPASGGFGGTSSELYAALGSGALFGSFAVNPLEFNGPALSFVLNSTAVADINADLSAGDPYFGIGGTVNATPLPSTWTMLIAGFAGLGFFAYRGSKKNAAAITAA